TQIPGTDRPSRFSLRMAQERHEKTNSPHRTRPAQKYSAGRHRARTWVRDGCRWALQESLLRPVCYHFCYPTPKYRLEQGGITDHGRSRKSQLNQPTWERSRLEETGDTELQ